MEELIRLLQKGLHSDLPGRSAHEKMSGRWRSIPEKNPSEAKESAVLQLIYPKNNEPHLLFIRRTEDGREHGGQISFPGGKYDPSDKDLSKTALREAEEEVGIEQHYPEILGALTPLYIPVSFFMVHPFVGWMNHRPDFLLNKSEVAEIIEVPLHYLMKDENKSIRNVRPASYPGMSMEVPAYVLNEETIIWGATAMMLSELEQLIKTSGRI